MSRFRVTYPLLLNVLRAEQMRVEDVLQRSYTENASLKSTLSRKARLEDIRCTLRERDELACLRCTGDNSIRRYQRTIIEYLRHNERFTARLLHAAYRLAELGRVVIVTFTQEMACVPAMIVKVRF